MSYVKETSPTTAVPYNPTRLKKDNPGISFPKVSELTEAQRNELLAQYNIYPLTIPTRPAYDKSTQTMEMSEPFLENGEWKVSWIVTDIPQADIDANIEEQALRSITATDTDKALGFLIADIWRSQNPGMTQNQARQAVRDRLIVHLKNIKGIA